MDSLELFFHGCISSCLTDRDQLVAFGGILSATVPHGSMLGPILFVFYTADIPRNIISYPMFIEPTITWASSGFSGYIWLDTKIVLKHIAEDFNLSIHCYEDDGQLHFYDRVQALPITISKVRVMHSRDRELDELNPSEAQFRRVHLAWKSSWARCNSLGVTTVSHISMRDHIQRCHAHWTGRIAGIDLNCRRWWYAVLDSVYHHLRQLRSIRGSLSVDSWSTARFWFVPSSPTGLTTATVSWLESANLRWACYKQFCV